MLRFTNKKRSLIVSAGVAIAVLAFSTVAAADEGQTEPAPVELTSVEVLPVHEDDTVAPLEEPITEPILEPGDSDVVPVVHDLEPGAIIDAPIVTPGEEPPMLVSTVADDTVTTVNSHVDASVGIEPADGFTDEPVPGTPIAELSAVAENTGWSVTDWATAATILVAMGAAVFGGISLFTRRRTEGVLAN